MGFDTFNDDKFFSRVSSYSNESLITDDSKNYIVSPSKRKENLSKPGHFTNLVLAMNRINSEAFKGEKIEDLILKVCDALVDTAGYTASIIIIFNGKEKVLAIESKGINNLSLIKEGFQDSNIINYIKDTISKKDIFNLKDIFEDCPVNIMSDIPNSENSIAASVEFKNEIYGVMVSTAEVSYSFQEEEIFLFNAIAGNVGAAIANIFSEQERKRVEKKYEFSKEMLKFPGDALSSALVIIDEEGKIFYSNSSWLHLIKLLKIVCEDYTDFILSSIEDSQDILNEIKWGIDEIKLGKREEFYIEMPLIINGSEEWFLTNINMFKYKDKNCFAISHYNITQRKICEDEMVRQNKELNGFALKVSQDIKTPLSILAGYLMLIKEEPQFFDNYYKKILGKAKDIEVIINGLFNESKAGWLSDGKKKNKEKE